MSHSVTSTKFCYVFIKKYHILRVLSFLFHAYPVLKIETIQIGRKIRMAEFSINTGVQRLITFLPNSQVDRFRRPDKCLRKQYDFLLNSEPHTTKETVYHNFSNLESETTKYKF